MFVDFCPFVIVCLCWLNVWEVPKSAWITTKVWFEYSGRKFFAKWWKNVIEEKPNMFHTNVGEPTLFKLVAFLNPMDHLSYFCYELVHLTSQPFSYFCMTNSTISVLWHLINFTLWAFNHIWPYAESLPNSASYMSHCWVIISASVEVQTSVQSLAIGFWVKAQ